MKRIYLDYAATTPVHPAVFRAMQPYFNAKFGNAGSLHSFGQEASAALDESRETIAKELGADFREIIFTASATEANNLALRGMLKSIKYPRSSPTNRELRSRQVSSIKRPRIITSAIEHESVLETARDMGKEGVEVVYLQVDSDGFVDLKKLESILDENTILVSIMSANNEIGTIEPISEISKIIQNFKNRKSGISFNYPITQLLNYPLFHVDHSQGVQYLDIKPKDLGIDLMTISSHKIYGPKGIAALYVGYQVLSSKYQELTGGGKLATGYKLLDTITTGGNQEFGLRSGTENIPAIAGFAKAVELVSNSRELENKRMGELRDYFWQEIKKISPNAELNGPPIQNYKYRESTKISDSKLRIPQIYKKRFVDSHKFVGSHRLSNNLNIYFPGHSAEDLLIKLDMAGIAVSAGSACSARSTKLSHVLQACGFSAERIKSSLRFTLGRPTIKMDIEEAVRRMKVILT